MDKMNTVFCSSCSKMFDLNKCKRIYRCGDAYVCSHSCSWERLRDLKNIDPGLKKPHVWPVTKSTSFSTLFGHEIIASKNIPNLKKTIIEKEHEYFGTANEEELIPFNSTRGHDEIIEEQYIVSKSHYETYSKSCNSTNNKYLIMGIPSLCIIYMILNYNYNI